MTARHKAVLWVVLPLIGLAAVFMIRVCSPAETSADGAPEPEVSVPTLPDSEPSQGNSDVIEICPSQLMSGFATDYSGADWVTAVNETTTVLITCGPDEGTYKLWVIDLNDVADQPDLYLESCGDVYCQGAYSLVMLEEVLV